MEADTVAQTKRQQQRLHKQLQQLIKRMQKIQRSIASQSQPASLHEVDQLKRLGSTYSQTIEQLAALNTSNSKHRNT